jgi:hypothetical protein
LMRWLHWRKKNKKKKTLTILIWRSPPYLRLSRAARTLFAQTFGNLKNNTKRRKEKAGEGKDQLWDLCNGHQIKIFQTWKSFQCRGYHFYRQIHRRSSNLSFVVKMQGWLK